MDRRNFLKDSVALAAITLESKRIAGLAPLAPWLKTEAVARFTDWSFALSDAGLSLRSTKGFMTALAPQRKKCWSAQT